MLDLLPKKGAGSKMHKAKLHEVTKLQKGTKLHGAKVARVHKVAQR